MSDINLIVLFNGTDLLFTDIYFIYQNKNMYCSRAVCTYCRIFMLGLNDLVNMRKLKSSNYLFQS